MLVLNLFGTSGGSRHERAMERELRRTEARLRVSLAEYEQKQRDQRKPSPTKVFSCTHGPDDTVREFLPGDGLFEISVTKFDVPSYTQQIANIREMQEVVLFNSEDKTVKLDLGEKYGKYDVEIARTPSAVRTDGRHKCDDNPFIHPVDHEICLGNARSLYDTTYKKGHYQECLKIIIKVLTCDDASGGFKKSWRECR